MSEQRPWLRHYAEVVPADIEVPAGSVVDLFRAAAVDSPDRVALDFLGATTTYAMAWHDILRAAAALQSIGVRPGDRVALVLPNCPQHVIAFYAALRLGAIVVEHNPLYTERELEQQLSDHEPVVVIAWDRVAPRVAAVAPQARVIAVDLTRALPLGKRLALRLPVAKARRAREAMTAPAPGVTPWHAFVGSAPVLDEATVGPASTDVALLQYTGGTTGVPKGAMLTHRNLLANAAQSRAWVPGLRTGAETFYLALPMFHAYGLTLGLTTAVLMRATVVLFPTFDPELVLQAQRRRPCTFLPGVPPMYPKLVAAAQAQGVDLSSIRVALTGAMALPTEVVDAWEHATGGLLVEGYGMTESSPISVGNPVAGTRRPGTIGIPFPSTTVRVVRPDDPSQEVPVGEAGELLVHGPQVFAGYWHRPEETTATLLEGGWLRTGDVVVQDGDGFLRIVDRLKELILVGGFNVYPSEVERVIAALPGVLDVSVVALRDGEREVVAAAVVPRPGATIDPEALRASCRDQLAAYKVPKRVVIVDELPRSLVGKVQRRQVQELLWDR